MGFKLKNETFPIYRGETRLPDDAKKKKTFKELYCECYEMKRNSVACRRLFAMYIYSLLFCSPHSALVFAPFWRVFFFLTLLYLSHSRSLTLLDHLTWYGNNLAHTFAI